MKSKLLIGSLSIALLFGLMSCADTNDETVTPNNTVEINSTSDASSTQLAGEETPSVNENGDTLVGGDAVA